MSADPTLIARMLLADADHVMRVDGDRDHMNQSNMICAQTQMIAHHLREAAAALSRALAEPTEEEAQSVIDVYMDTMVNSEAEDMQVAIRAFLRNRGAG